MKWRRMKPKNNLIWHDWFAWHPVVLMEGDGYTISIVWLEIIERRKSSPIEFHWEYRA